MDDHITGRELPGLLIDAQRFRPDHGRFPHAAGHNRGVAGHPAAAGEYALRGHQPVNIVGVGFRPRQNDLALRCQLDRLVGVKHDGAGGRSRTGGQALPHDAARGVWIEPRMQELFQRRRLRAQQRLFFGDQLLVHHVDGNLDRGLSGALPAARLQQVERAVFDGELDVLHVAVVLLQQRTHVHELPVRLGEIPDQLADGLGRADAGDDVFPLRVEQVLPVHLFLARRRIAGKRHPGAGGWPQVAKHHGLHVHRRAQIMRNLVKVPVGDGPGVVPRFEDGVDGHLQLLPGILGERLAGTLPHQAAVLLGQRSEVAGAQLGVLCHPTRSLGGQEDVLEELVLQPQHHVAKHLHEPAVGVVGKSRIARCPRQPLHRRLVEPQVEDGVHHARHAKLRTGPHGHQQWFGGIAEALAGPFLQQVHLLPDLIHQAGGELPGPAVVL